MFLLLIEVIIGHNSDEGLIFIIPYVLNPSLWAAFQENFDTVAPTLLFNIGNASDITKIDVENAHKLLEYYVGTVESINGENIQGIVDLFTDAWFSYGHHKTVDYLLKHGVTTFQYYFSYRG